MFSLERKSPLHTSTSAPPRFASRRRPAANPWFKLSTTVQDPAARDLGTGTTWQPKLTMGQHDDPLERQTDRVADAVASGAAAPSMTGSGKSGETLPEVPSIVEQTVQRGDGPLDASARLLRASFRARRRRVGRPR